MGVELTAAHARPLTAQVITRSVKMKKFSLLDFVLLRVAMFWFVVSPLVVLWDAAFVLMRPRSLPGGDLHFIWKPYALYITIDKPYGDTEDTFVIAQSWMNLVEVVLSLITARLLSQLKPSAMFVGFLTSTMTFWKTVLYTLQYTWLCKGAHRLAHLSWIEFLFLFLLPNGLWLVFPFIFMLWFGAALLKSPRMKSS